MRLLERLVLLTLLISFPIQLGKHFWPDFAFVQGVRLDYLSPTLYLNDILVVLLFVVSLSRLRRALIGFLISKPVLITLGCVSLGMAFSVSPLSAFYGILKLVEFIWIGFYFSHITRNEIPEILFSFALGALVQTAILSLQFIDQRSIGGLFYYLGERTFDSLTPGVALTSFGEHLFLRPYGTFPHPNVLAFYLLVSYTFILFFLPNRSNLLKSLKPILLTILFVGIVTTFSRIIILLLFMTSTVYFWKTKYISFVLAAIGLIVVLLLPRFLNLSSDTMTRLSLIPIGFDVLLKNLLFGTGLNNFFYHEVLYQKTITPVLLQPIHNIFLHWLVSTGLVGLIPLVMFIKRIVIIKKNTVTSLLLIVLAVSGMFDRYLVTIQQGELLLAFSIGLVFSQLRKFKVQELALVLDEGTLHSRSRPMDR